MIGLIVYWNVPLQMRMHVLLLLSGIFLFIIADTVEVILLITYVFIGYGLIKFCYGRKHNAFFNSAITFWIVIYLLIGGYVYKLSGFELVHFPIITGVSYILFRVLQILFDLKEGIYSSYLSPSKYILFCLNFLTLISGPIQRVEDFIAQVDIIPKATFKEIDHLSVFYRLSIGLVKVLFLSSILILEHQSVLDSFLKDPQWNSLKFALTSIIYLVFLYINFSGYMDIIISVGNLFGFKLPENFYKPFLAKNFLDFWERWHISLSGWMKDYVFTPLLKTLVYWKSGYWWVLFFGVIVYFITFLLLGIWHGTSSLFFFCGIMLALGASITKIMQVGMKPILSLFREFEVPFIGSLAQGVLSGIVFAHISFAIIGFWLTWDQFLFYWNMMSAFKIVELYFLTSIMGMSLYFIASFLEKISESSFCSRVFFKEGCVAVNLYFVVFAFFEYWNIAPEFVYQGF